MKEELGLDSVKILFYYQAPRDWRRVVIDGWKEGEMAARTIS